MNGCQSVYEFLSLIHILVARRIVCRLKPGQKVIKGAKFGIIKFGSRLDIYLPLGVKIKILKGQTAVGGETVLAAVNE